MKRRIDLPPPSLKEVYIYAYRRERIDLARNFYDYYKVNNWVDGRGNKVVCWRQKFITWERFTPYEGIFDVTLGLRMLEDADELFDGTDRIELKSMIKDALSDGSARRRFYD